MKKLLEYLPFHFLIGLVVGICTQYFMNVWMESFVMVFTLFLGMFYLKKKRVFVLCTWLFFFLFGAFLTYEADHRNADLYYENFWNDKNSSILQVKEVLKSNTFSHRYKMDVIQVDSTETLGIVLLSIRKDSLFQELKVDEQILIRSNFTEVNPPLNPHQFDYKAYLARQGIHQQVYLNANEFLRLELKPTFLGWIAKIRMGIQHSLQQEGFSQEEFGVINALLLGQRQEVSKELLNDYSKAGAIHILAISGLHVGIILLILSWVFKPLEFIKNGRFLKLILIVFVLWFFALLAGMSASVVRAVTMFTAVAIGQSLQRKNSIVHSLVFSMFVLLLFKPMFLFDVGFQLSYLAVYGIVTIQPKLTNLWKPKWKLFDKIWQLTTVSVAAQLAVLPLSLFYFHQFPGLFLLSNLVIVPFLGVILIGGILMILLSVMYVLPDILVNIYGTIISWMNDFIRFVSHQEEFLLSGISFSSAMLFSSYLVIGLGYQFFERKRGNRLLWFLGSLLLFQSVLFFEKYESQTQHELLVFHQRRESIYGIREGNQLHVFDSIGSNRTLDAYTIGERVQLEEKRNQRAYLNYKDQDILFVDSLGVYELGHLRSPIVVLQYSPKVNLNRLIDDLYPKQIVADGSNYRSLLVLWERTCVERNVLFWNTSKDGAYRLNGVVSEK